MVLPIGMTTISYDPFAPAAAFGPYARKVDTLDELLAHVGLHCPLTPQTHDLIGQREFGLMKPSALLINTARGEVVNEQALVEALKSGRIAGAGLDSFALEPPASDNPLWALPNVIVTPHCGGVTASAQCAHVLAGRYSRSALFRQSIGPPVRRPSLGRGVEARRRQRTARRRHDWPADRLRRSRPGTSHWTNCYPRDSTLLVVFESWRRTGRASTLFSWIVSRDSRSG
jgi:D-isomer specific 2-hydroxyacid dehydrogenase, NAD binding domain